MWGTNQKCLKEPTVLPQNHDSLCGESRQQRSHTRWSESWQRCCPGHTPCSWNENLWQWPAPPLPLVAPPTEQHWPGSLQAMGIHDYPFCSRAPWPTLTHPDTPRHTLAHLEGCTWLWISTSLALTCPEHSNLSLEVLALWSTAGLHGAGFHHLCSSPWFQVFRGSLLSCVIALLCINYHN